MKQKGQAIDSSINDISRHFSWINRTSNTPKISSFQKTAEAKAKLNVYYFAITQFVIFFCRCTEGECLKLSYQQGSVVLDKAPCLDTDGMEGTVCQMESLDSEAQIWCEDGWTFYDGKFWRLLLGNLTTFRAEF